MIVRRIWRPFQRYWIQPLSLLAAPVPPPPQTERLPQMLFKSRSWRDVERSLKECPTDAYSLVLAWNALKSLPDGSQSPVELLEELLEKTTGVTEELSATGYASVWQALAKLNLLKPELLQKLTVRLHGASEELPMLSQLSPRNLTSVIYAVAKLHRLARVRQQLSPKGECFSGESALAAILIKESMKRLNEFNERDLAALVMSLGLLQQPQSLHVGHQLAQEVERMFHLKRLYLGDIVNIAFGLTEGCGVDLFQAAPRFVRALLSPQSCAEYSHRQLALLLRCLSQMPDPTSHVAQIRPLFYKLVHPDVLPNLHSLELRSVIRGLGIFRLKDPELWVPFSNYLIDQDFKGLSAFDVTAVLYSMSSVQYQNVALLDKMTQWLCREGVLQRLQRLGFSNCFYGVARLDYRNGSFIQALCTSLLQRELVGALLPSQLANVVFSLAQLGFRHDPLIEALVSAALSSRKAFPNRALLHFLFGLSLNLYYGSPSVPVPLFEELLDSDRLQSYTDGELGMALCATGKMKPAMGHRWAAVLQEVQSERRMRNYSLQDVIRIVKALQDLNQPVPHRFKERLMNDIQHIQSLPNRALLDLLRCLRALGDEQMSVEMEAALKEALSDDRLQKLRGDEISAYMISLVCLSRQFSSESDHCVEEILEKVIVQGSLQQLTGRALYFALSSLGHSRRCQNRPVLYSLTIESTKKPRLALYNEQELTGVFYNLSILNALHRVAFDAVVEEMLKPERLSRYREQHVVKVMRGLSIGRHRNSQITNTLLNAFLQQDMQLQSASVAALLFNLVLLRSWKQPYVDLLLGQISREVDLSGYGIWEIGMIIYVLGRMQHRHEAALKLLTQEVKPERLKDATQMDLCNLVFGLARLRLQTPDVVQPLLCEVLKSSRCQSYSVPELVKLLESLSEWRIADPTQLIGLITPLCDPQRAPSLNSLQLMTVLRALAKLRLLDEALVGPLLSEFTASEARLSALSVEHLLELSYLMSLAGAASASARVQNILTAKQRL